MKQVNIGPHFYIVIYDYLNVLFIQAVDEIINLFVMASFPAFIESMRYDEYKQQADCEAGPKNGSQGIWG